MEKKQFEQLNETLYTKRLANGLELCIVPKPNFNKTYATFTTRYGSVDNEFIPLGRKEWTKVPDGIAHFLEHKMFEKEDGTDVFQDFSQQGASANAFTSFTRTAYLFSSTSELEKNLKTLIDFVQTPAFTKESVEKEKGIIGQEIQMYNDQADWRVYYGLIENMYHNHPIKIDIAGTIESISHITVDNLLECYNTFYHPSNMLLFIVGPVEPDHILTLVEKNQENKDYSEQDAVSRRLAEEPDTVVQPSSTIKMSVQSPKLLIGFKERQTGRKGEAWLKHELSIQLLLELMFGKGSDHYQKLTEEGLTDDSFGYEYTEEGTFGFSAIGGDTDQPDVLRERLLEMIESSKKNGINEEDFKRTKKKRIGGILRALNSPEYIANQFTRYHFNEMDLFQLIPTLESLTSAELEITLKEHFVKEAMTSCAVVKK